MKKILFCINNMKMGGIQKSLTELLNVIHSQYEITLFCINPVGELLENVPSDVRLVAASDILKASDLSIQEATAQGLVCTIARAFGSAISKRWTRRIPAMIVTRCFQKHLGDFDAAISFSQPVEEHQFYNLCNEVVLNACSSATKITWVHCDFQQYGGNSEMNRRLYMQFDRIAACSNSVGKRLAEAIPEVKEKIFTVYNCHDVEKIRSLSEVDSVVYDCPAIVSVSRLTEEKGLLRALDAVKVAVDQNYYFSWHIVGSGPLMNILQQKVKHLGLQDRVSFCGQQKNPYRYMKNASLLFLPSFHEAAPMVFDEAMIVGIPVLSTDTLSAKELVVDRGIGWVCENTDEGVTSGLIYSLDAIMKGKPIVELCFDNLLPIKQFERLLCGDES